MITPIKVKHDIKKEVCHCEKVRRTDVAIQ